MTEGWDGALMYDAWVQLYHGDEWSDPLLPAAVPILQPWWMTNYPLVSHCLMNIKCQVCDVCVCVCVCARPCKDQAERLQRKLGKAFCYNLSPTHVSIATHILYRLTHTYICTHTACHVLSRCSSFLLYCPIPVPISLPGDSGPGPELPQAPIWIKPS